MEKLLWVCLSGGLGSGARYLVDLEVTRRWGSDFPLGTLAVNLLGSFLLALLLTYFLKANDFHPGLKAGLTTGFMGGFTTYSTYNYQTLQFLERGAYGEAALYIGTTLVGCLGFAFLGMRLAS